MGNISEEVIYVILVGWLDKSSSVLILMSVNGIMSSIFFHILFCFALVTPILFPSTSYIIFIYIFIYLICTYNVSASNLIKISIWLQFIWFISDYSFYIYNPFDMITLLRKFVSASKQTWLGRIVQSLKETRFIIVYPFQKQTTRFSIKHISP